MTGFHGRQFNYQGDESPIPFPVEHARETARATPRDSIQLAMFALGLADRRMTNLANILGCLGHSEPDEDGPRAA